MLLCVRIPEYPLAVALSGYDHDDLCAIVADRPNRGHVLALSASARAQGAAIGQTVTQAVAAASSARVIVHDTARAATVWEEVLDALDAVTPLIDDVREGIAFLDMRGIDGDTAMWIERIEAALARFDLPLTVGSGPNRFCAFAASWIGHRTTIAEGEEAQTLASLPLEVLTLDENVQARLHLLGIKTLGELAKLPHGPFVRRFGRASAQWHDWARGVDRTPFVPRGHAISIEASLFGEGSAESEEAVIFALRVLLSRICSDLERCGKRASALQLDIELESGQTNGFEIVLALPTADDRAMLDVLRAKLEGMSFDAPLSGLRLRALRLEEGGEALPLVRNDDIDPQNVAVVLARLEAMLGEPVRRARTKEAHQLEERFTYEPFAVPKRDATPALATPRVVPQLRLLTVTEIDVSVARGEPVRVGGHTVLECSGPWRIEEAWFSSAVARDEYDVVLDDGELCRIYRQGNRWYLRGTYD